MEKMDQSGPSDLYYEKRTIDSKNNTITNTPLNTNFEQQLQPLRMVRTMSLANATIPHTWYNISGRLENNIAIINGVEVEWPETNLSDALDPDAVPVAPIIVGYLNTQLTAAFPGGTWDVLLDLNRRITLDISAGAPVGTFQVSKGLGCLLGIDPDIVYDVATDLPIVATNLIDFQPIKKVNLRIFNGATGILTDGRSQAATFDIPVGNTIYGDFIQYESREGHINIVPFEMNGSNCMVSNIGVNIVDDRGIPIDLNGVAWTLSLGFRQDPRERPLPEGVGSFFVD